MSDLQLHAVAAELQQAALDAVDPAAAIHRHVSRTGDELIVDGRGYKLDDYERVFVVGGGKAAVPMAAAIGGIIDERLDQGVVVTKYGHTQTVGSRASDLDLSALPVRIIEAGHPVPDGNSVRGAQAVADLVRHATAQDLVVCLISGGGSALWTLPVPSLTLRDLQDLTDDLLRSGATIHEINAVRKHSSRIKGGNLARLAAPADVITLVLSDVVGDPLDVIASGPTVPDTTTVGDAREVLERYGIAEGREGLSFLRETPKPGDVVFEHVQHVIVGSNRQGAMAAVEKARQLGFEALLLSTYVEGEAREVAKVAAGLAKGVRTHGDPLSPPACLVWGGETTVTVRGQGKGGRNQELALAAALAIDGWSGVLMMALATDGTDGPTDAAGAIVTGDTIRKARELGLDPRAALESNDSYHFFEASGDLIFTGPTRTNVNDLLFVLVDTR
ncbi:MAG: glycerate kinase [Anaerolineae bacterium]